MKLFVWNIHRRGRSFTIVVNIAVIIAQFQTDSSAEELFSLRNGFVCFICLCELPHEVRHYYVLLTARCTERFCKKYLCYSFTSWYYLSCYFIFAFDFHVSVCFWRYYVIYVILTLCYYVMISPCYYGLCFEHDLHNN